MTGGVDSDEGEPEKRSRPGRLLLTAVLALALVATAVMVLTSSAPWLRLGVLAALWAALLGAFLAANYRRQVSDRDGAIAELRAVYELELEREISARREHEVEIEAESRRRARDESQTDLAALRAELRALRENLERLAGGEVLVERFALRAQSTRMRTLGEVPGRAAVANQAIARGLVAGHRIAPDMPAHPVVEPVGPMIDDVDAAISAAPLRLQPVRGWGYRQNYPQPEPHDEPASVPRPDDPGRDRQAPGDDGAANRSATRRLPNATAGWHRPDPPAATPPASVSALGRRHHQFTDDAGEATVVAAAATAAESQPDRGGRRRRHETSDAGTTMVSRHALSADPDEMLESGGAHTEGRSVSELLAAMGDIDRPRRHRHRAT